MTSAPAGFGANAEPEAILVVEDEVTLHHIFAKVAEIAGGEAFLAVNAAEARKLLAERTFSAALLDKNLPDASGIDVLKVIKQQQPRVEVLMVTGFANLESAVQALRLGAFDYIEKPFDLSILAARLKAALARRRRQAADVAQNLEGQMDRLAGELEVISQLVSGAIDKLKTAATAADVAAPLRDLEQSAESLHDAVDGAKQIVQALSQFGR